jgi:serine/threonine protein kinase
MEFNIAENGINNLELPELFTVVLEVEVEVVNENNFPVYFMDENNVVECQIVDGHDGLLAIELKHIPDQSGHQEFQARYVIYNQDRGIHCTVVDRPKMKVRIFHFQPRLQSTMDSALREIPLMYHFMQLADPINPDLPQIVDHFLIGNRIHIVEPCDMNKRSFVNYCNQLPVDAKMILFRLLLRSLNKLHSVRYAHRNLTLDNIYYSVSTNTVSIDGFEFVCQTTEHKYHPRLHNINRAYAAPEMVLFDVRLLGQDINGDARSTDIWSLGLILFELLTCYRLWNFPNIAFDVYYFYFVSQGGSIRNYIQTYLPPTLLPNEPHLVLLENMLQINPNDRWTIANVIDYVNQHFG